MRYLSQGSESKSKIELLLKLTKITSEGMTGALIDYFVRNFGVSASASLNGVKQPHLSDAITKLNAVAEVVEKINELNYTR